MQLKKLLQGSAFALVAVACAIAVPSVVKAEDITGKLTEAGLAASGAITWDSANAEVTITGDTGVKEVMVGFAKVDKNKNVKVTSWDVYDGNKATVDLSKLSNVKDNYLAITTPNKAVAVIKIPQTDKVIKTKFNALTGVLQVGTGATGGAATPADLVYDKSATDKTKNTASLYEYRTAYSDWQDFVTGTTGNEVLKDLKFYQEEGAKLFVRLKAEVPAQNATIAQGDETLKYGEQEVKVYDGYKLAGKEGKVTIPAKAKGPKVAADYVKGTVKFPKNSEYRYVTSNGIVNKVEAVTSPTTKPAELFSTTDAKSPTDLLKEAKGSATTDVTTANPEVRTKATEKKPASKWTTFKLDAPRALIAYQTGGTTVDATKSFISGDNRLKFSGTGRTGATGTDATAAAAIVANSTLKAPDEASGSDWVGKGVAGVKSAKVVEAMKADNSGPDSSADSVLKVDYAAVGKVKEQYFTANALKITNRGADNFCWFLLLISKISLYRVKSIARYSAKMQFTNKNYLRPTNSGKLTYEIVVGDKPEATKKGTKVSTKEVTIKNVKDAQHVWIRVAGDKKSGVWTGEYAELGVVDFPYTIPKKQAEQQ